MTGKAKAGLGISGICILAMGVSAAASQFGEGMEIRTEGGTSYISEVSTAVSYIPHNTVMPEEDFVPDDILYEEYDDIGITVSFTATPDEKRSSKTELVFVSDSPQTVIIVPTEQEYSVSEEYRVVGYIEAVTDNSLCLADCEIEVVFSRSDPYESTSAPEISAVPERSPTTERAPAVTQMTTSSQRSESTVRESVPVDTDKGQTVYVSATGKYHSKPTCSGMKSYTEMSITQAESGGNQPCKKCYK